MTGYVLLSEAVPLVAARLYEGGADAARKCEQARRLLGFSEGDVFYPSMVGLTAVELDALRKSIDKIYEWLCSSKLCAFGLTEGCSNISRVEASDWGYRGISDIRCHLSAIRRSADITEIENIKVDQNEIKRLIAGYANVNDDAVNVCRLDMLPQGQVLKKSKGGRPRTPGDSPLVAEMHRLLLDGKASSQREAARMVLPEAKKTESNIHRLCKAHREAWPNYRAKVEAARQAREAARAAVEEQRPPAAAG